MQKRLAVNLPIYFIGLCAAFASVANAETSLRVMSFNVWCGRRTLHGDLRRFARW
jgi:hypothetical protein